MKVMSLCALKDLGINTESWVEYVSKLENIGYRNGVQVAKSVGYNSENLRELILCL